MPRSTPEWIGATPDTPVPPRVKLRVFRDHGGICHISGRKIRAGEPWDADHVKALCNGGENRESNLKPALRDKHRRKTKDDVAERVETDHMAMAHLGIKKTSGRKIRSQGFNGWRRFDGTIVRKGRGFGKSRRELDPVYE